MELELHGKLEKDDLLLFQMYAASQNPTITGQRKRGRIYLLIICLALGLIFLIQDNQFVGWYFVVTGIISTYFYPKYLNYFYKRLFRKQLDRIYKDRLPLSVYLKFEDEVITYKDDTKNTQIKIERISKIIELEAYFYLKLNELEYMIVRKSDLENESKVRDYLLNMAEQNRITYSREFDWKWK